MTEIKRFAAIALTTALVSGCAAPVPLTVATLVMDGFSYATTDKSMTDHGISALADKYCAVHRVLNNQYMCRHLPKNTDVAKADHKTAPGYQSLKAQQTAHANPLAMQTAASGNLPGVYMVLASSTEQHTANVYAAHYNGLKPKLFAMPTGADKVSYHLLMGPVTRGQFEDARVSLRARGLNDVWALKVDALDWALSRELIGKVRPVQAALKN